MGKHPNDRLQGTLDLLILKSLASRGVMHGYGITVHIRGISGDALRVEEGSLYPALHRMAQEGWVRAKWGASENNRRARFYSITPKGLQQLSEEERRWSELTAGCLSRSSVRLRNAGKMAWHSRIWNTLRATRLQRELDEELRFHRELSARDLQSAGSGARRQG